MDAAEKPGGSVFSRRPGDLIRLREAERAQGPFLVYRDAAGLQHIRTLADVERLLVGRDSESDVVIDWDEWVSRSHLALERLGAEWSVLDDGLSRNGTFVNGERVRGRRRLRDRDVVRVGRTLLLFRAPTRAASDRTTPEGAAASGPLSPAQRRVLVALCRPSVEAGRLAVPPSNQRLAEELHLSLDAVKAHLRHLFTRFGVETLPQNEKRMRLAECALEAGFGGPEGF